jgi:hypothetical protein
VKYHGVIFHHAADKYGPTYGQPPVKVAGPYAISSICGVHGYNIKVFDNIIYLIEEENNFDLLKEWLSEHISDNTIFFGFSTTFCRNWEKFKPLIDYLYIYYPDVDIIVGGNGSNSNDMYEMYKDKISHSFSGIADNSIVKYLKESEAAPEFINETSYVSKDETVFKFPHQQPMFRKMDTVLQNETLPIMVARGCRFKCKFCAYPFLGRLPTDDYVRTEKSLYDELLSNRENFNTKYYMVSDDTFNETTDKLLRFKKVKDKVSSDSIIWAHIRLELLERFPDQISILRDMGLKSCFLGIESFNLDSRKSIGKGISQEKLYRTIGKLKEALGETSNIHAGLIVGLPYDNHKTVEEWSTSVINKEMSLDSITVNGLGISKSRGTLGTGDLSEFDENAEKYGYTRTEYGWENDTWNSIECAKIARDIMIKYYKNNWELHVVQANLSGLSLMNMSSLDDKYDWDYMHQKHKSLTDRDKFVKTVRDGSMELYKKYAREVFLT